jgi:acetolactate synthase-1/2/3 large subunit
VTAAGAASGADLLCRALVRGGVDTVFGLPGTQNVPIYEALRLSRLRVITASHELGASFMANGYGRISGRPGVLVTIPGPGFTYALTGLAEAYLDSVPVVHVVEAPARRAGRRFALQAIDQAAMAAPVVKRVLRVGRREDIVSAVEAALAVAAAEEPGPVLVEIDGDLLSETGPGAAPPASAAAPAPHPDPATIAELTRRVARAGRVVFYVGQGAAGAATDLRALAERLRAPVVATTSGRGTLPEDHPLGLPFDFGAPATEAINEIFRRADLILALGCKFSHNGAHGFRLEMPPAKLVHVDLAPQNLGANYPAELTLCGDVAAVVCALRARLPEGPLGRAWAEDEVPGIWRRARAAFASKAVEPRVRGVSPETPEAFFDALGRALPEGACLITDSGLHQMLARRHFRVRSPRGLVVPTNLQSMGFAIPAAIGASRAAPGRAVCALVGDGGLVMSGLELLSAVREGVPLTVIVFNDGHLGLIRLMQLGTYGHAFATEVLAPDLEALAAALGVSYTLVDEGAESRLKEAVRRPGVHLLEVQLGDRVAFRRVQARALAGRALHRVRRSSLFRGFWERG